MFLFKNVLVFAFFVFLKPHIQNSHHFWCVYSYTVERDVKSGYFQFGRYSPDPIKTNEKQQKHQNHENEENRKDKI